MTSRGRKGSEGKTTVPEGPASNPMPTTNNVATSTPVTGPVAKPTSPAGSVAIFFFFFYSLHLQFTFKFFTKFTVYPYSLQFTLSEAMLTVTSHLLVFHLP